MIAHRSGRARIVAGVGTLVAGLLLLDGARRTEGTWHLIAAIGCTALLAAAAIEIGGGLAAIARR